MLWVNTLAINPIAAFKLVKQKGKTISKIEMTLNYILDVVIFDVDNNS